MDLSLAALIAHMRNFMIIFTLSILAVNLLATFVSIRRQKKQKDAPQFDDITMLGLRYRGGKGQAPASGD